MKRFLFLCSLWVFIALLVSACVGGNEPRETQTPIPEGMRAIDLEFSIVNASSYQPDAMRATTGADSEMPLSLAALLRATEEGDKDQDAYTPHQLNENKVERLDIFLYENGSSQSGSFFKHFTDTEVVRLSSASDTDPDTYKVRLLVPYSQIATYQGRDFHITIVANAKPETMEGITSLELLQKKIQEDDLVHLSSDKKPQPQAHFLMDGSGRTGVISFSDNCHTVANSIELKRAAAKIRLRVQDADIFDYQNGAKTKYVRIGTMQVKLISYVNKTSVVAGHPYTPGTREYHATDYRDMTPRTLPTREGNGSFIAPFPFYAYENSWEGEGDMRETYLIVKLRLRPESSPSDGGKDYFYRLPINYAKSIKGVTQEMLHRVSRNHLYDVLTQIEVLGSLSENEPMDVTSYVAIRPWNSPDVIDGTLTDAHYLVVKEKKPKMLNVDRYHIDYASDLPVEVKIEEVYCKYYDAEGKFVKKVEAASQTTIKLEGVHTDGRLVIEHTIPKNYLPLNIKLKVKQQGGDLEENVHVIQYPHRYLTYKKSTGRGGGKSFDESGKEIFADFRYHTTFGHRGQVNAIFTRITTLVPEAGEKIGNPENSSERGNTGEDAETGELISPQFVMATQYGMSSTIKQYNGQLYRPWYRSGHWHRSEFNTDYGPESSFFKREYPYRNHDKVTNRSFFYGNTQEVYQDYLDAGSRAKQYFEGEYGENKTYVEHYIDRHGRKQERKVRKEFQYPGHWRLPTAAELKVVAKIQADTNSEVKDLLRGQIYWCAEPGKGVRVLQSPYEKESIGETNVRLVFDTWKWDEEAAYE